MFFKGTVTVLEASHAQSWEAGRISYGKSYIPYLFFSNQTTRPLSRKNY